MKLTMKLTPEDFECAVSPSWNQVELHTAECVAEAVAEVKKTRFEIGETVEVLLSKPITGTVCVMPDDGLHRALTRGQTQVRRPPRTRKMTPKELLVEVYGKSNNSWAMIAEKLAEGITLEAMAKDLNISIEVEVE
jgi:hypothetical protein